MREMKILILKTLQKFSLFHFLKYLKKMYKSTIKHLRKLSLNQVLLISIVLSLLILTIYVFMQFTLLIRVDSSVYYKYLDYFKGKTSFAFWDTTRGFGFPLILFLITRLFGDSINGVLVGFLLFYLGMIYCAIKIVFTLIKENNLIKSQSKYWIFFIIFFLFNPLIIGYSHIMMTEAVIPCLYMLTAFLCLKWNKVYLRQNKRKFISYAIIFIFLGILIWFIKQPYIITYWSLLCFSAILSGIYHKNIKIFCQKAIVLVFCFLFTLLSINCWDIFLKINGKQSNIHLSNLDSISNTNIFSNNLTLGYSYHYKRVYKNEFCSVEYMNALKLNKANKKKIIHLIKNNNSWCDYLSVFNIYDMKGIYKETDIIVQKNSRINLIESLSFYLKSILKHPILMADSYYHNYLAILDFENLKEGVSEYVPTGMIDSEVKRENQGIGYGVFYDGQSNCWWKLSEEDAIRYSNMKVDMSQYEDFLHPSDIATLMKILSKFSDITFMFFLYFSFPIFIYGFILFLKKKNHSYFMITILSGASFFNIWFHVMMDAIIDRYCYPVYPLMLLCVIIMLMDKKAKV